MSVISSPPAGLWNRRKAVKEVIVSVAPPSYPIYRSSLPSSSSSSSHLLVIISMPSRSRSVCCREIVVAFFAQVNDSPKEQFPIGFGSFQGATAAAETDASSSSFPDISPWLLINNLTHTSPTYRKGGDNIYF